MTRQLLLTEQEYANAQDPVRPLRASGVQRGEETTR